MYCSPRAMSTMLGGLKNFHPPETRVFAQANNPSCQHDDERLKDLRQAQSYAW